MADRVSSITDLPVDVLVLIFPYLDAKDFLALCGTCKALQQDSIRLDAAYWRHATQAAFRVRNQPVIEHDGVRWQKLYRRMLTQSRVFTWGSNSYHRLGHSYPQPQPARRGRGPRIPVGRRFQHNSHIHFPTPMEKVQELGVIADMQCGGWSTTLLTSKGSLHTCGVLDGMQIIHNHRPDNGPEALRFPVGYPYSTQLAAYEEPTIAIRQFSAGRTHILALSDSGRIWSWYAVHKPALHVKFLNVSLTEASSGESSAADNPLYGRVKQVVAGWSRSSAYIYGTGIVVWDTVHREQNQNDEMDTMLVMENAEVPKTGYQRPRGAYRETEEEKALGQEVGAVLSYIILEAYIVFVTDNGKIFCGRLGDKHYVEQILELRALRNQHGIPSDVQGSFRSFAIFKDGEVIITNQDYLDACWNVRHDTENDHAGIGGLKRIPALQHKDVISVAFGDYHFLALHSDGKITSYGTEAQKCGALGLGGDGDPEGRTRGIRYHGIGHDGKLLPHCYTTGRQVWFEEEKKQWIRFITSGGKDPAEAKERMRLFIQDANVQGEVSEWFEQQGRDWDKDPELKDYDQDGLGSYFALSISAAGWHSGAVVLVNDNLAEQVSKKCIIRDPDAPPEEEAEGSGSSGIIATYSSWLAGLGRDFLGLPPAGQQQPQNVLEEVLPPVHNPRNFLNPINHGASPGKGFKYVWAEKSFPRLRLSNGEEMPGTVDFDEWRFERPEWDLNVDV